MRKIVYLEWVRGTAAVMVALYHLLQIEWPQMETFSRHYVDFGRVGIVAFFLVSGYIIPVSFERQTIRTFLIRRIFRLYPIYLIAVTIYIPLGWPHADWSSPSWWVMVILNYTMMHNFVGQHSIIGPAWTLSIEWAFYAQQIVAKRFGWFHRDWALGYGWLILYLAMCATERISGHDLPTTIPMLISIACLGKALYLTQAQVVSRSSFLSIGATTLVLIPLGATMAVDAGTLWNPVNYSLSFLAGVAWFAVAFVFRNRDGGRVLVWLGSISYAIYLTHPIVRALVYLVADGPAAVVIALNVLLVPLVAWAAHRLIERPGIEWGRRLSKGAPKGSERLVPRAVAPADDLA